MIGANALLTALAVVTLVLAVVLNQTNTQNFKLKEAKAPENSQVLSETDDKKDEELNESATPISTTTPVASPVTAATKKPSSTPTTKPTTQIELNSFWYPGANVILRETNNFTLSSFDNVDKITQWYQDKLSELKMPAKSLAKTNTNGNVIAKLAAAKETTQVNIEIKKYDGDTLVSIKVDISPN